MKRYRRAELENGQGEDLIEKLYVDPLPHEHVYKTLRQANTTFLVGRKGTGKSTVFLRAQKSLLNDSAVLSTYVDIKTVYESAQVDPALVQRMLKHDDALSEESLGQLTLMTSFLQAVVAGIRDDLDKQLKNSWRLRAKEAFTGTYSDLTHELNKFIRELSQPVFVDVQGLRTVAASGEVRQQTGSGSSIGGRLALGAGSSLRAEVTESFEETNESQEEYSKLLLRTVDVKRLILTLKNLIEPLGAKRLFIFVDDFSELPLEAMRTVVDVLIAPLNNWSEELVKFKVAAYPGRVYYGALDKSKFDEVNLDLYNLYGQSSVADMEEKGVDFTRRLLETRLRHFGVDAQRFIEPRSESAVWMALFQASLGNPRTLGYILYFIYENQLLYGKRISVVGVKDAAQRYYEEKLEPYFAIGRFLHESFEERSTIFSLRELLERIVTRARVLRSKDAASIFRKIDGQHPTSHFNVPQTFDSLLSTLELNFFVTKYYVMSNRDGHRVSVYALNYGLCEKQSIAFGRPSGSREQRLYFVERVFDNGPLLRDYIASNQEITCDNCRTVFAAEDLDALRRFNMLCPTCRAGTCRVTNISRKYEDLLRGVLEEQMLPAAELGILQTLNSEAKALYAGDIAGELDVSYQLIGKRAKRLDEQDLVEREMVRGRREYKLSATAKRVYFSDTEVASLRVDD